MTNSPLPTKTEHEIGMLTGTLTLDGKPIDGKWTVAVYFIPGQEPRKPGAYLIGFATRVE